MSESNEMTSNSFPLDALSQTTTNLSQNEKCRQEDEKSNTKAIELLHNQRESSNTTSQPTTISTSVAPTDQVYLSPPVTGFIQEIPSISPRTMAEILNGKYGESYRIIDCRYPHEFERGHIMGAKNFHIKKDILEELFPRDVGLKSGSRPALIFHSEYSSSRSKSVYRFIRRKDRLLSKELCTSLFFPEMYVLEGGFSGFYAEHKEHCISQAEEKKGDEGKRKEGLPMTEREIKELNLTGDCSKALLLPTVQGRFNFKDIPTILPSTMKEILEGKHGGSFLVIDCRYPYEYHGGHIKGAKNFYTKKETAEALFPNDIHERTDPNPILIFYCEFSSRRGPTRYQYVRRQDRKLNRASYPSLYYPEMYLLEGGYCAFHTDCKEYCQPQTYKLMLDVDSLQDFVHFFVKRRVVDNDGSEQEAVEVAKSIIRNHFKGKPVTAENANAKHNVASENAKEDEIPEYPKNNVISQDDVISEGREIAESSEDKEIVTDESSPDTENVPTHGDTGDDKTMTVKKIAWCHVQ